MAILTQILNTMTGLLTKIETWIDETFSLFTNYSAGYSNLIMYGALLLIISKFFKLHIKVSK